MQSTSTTSDKIPEQTPVSWGLALTVSWGSLRRRLMRSLVTMLGVILAIAFLTYMLITDNITAALVGANIDELNLVLQKNGIDIFEAGKTDQMMLLLIGLSLLTCLVGIINAMLMAVTERIKEIGTLKCLGALDSFIVKTYFIESSIQGIIGTLLGMTIGLSVAVAVSVNTYHGYVFSTFPALAALSTLLWAFVVGAAISVSASILPAYMAAKKEPVDAMRVEE